MKLRSCITAAAALSIVICHGQGWETIYSLPNGSGHAILEDPDPSIRGLFIGGKSDFGSVLHLDQSTEPPTDSVSDSTPDFVLALNADSVGNLYSAGHSSNWQVRRSQNGGVTWDILDDGRVWSSKEATLARGVAADESGNVYSSGRIRKKNGNYWIIRRGANNGSSWSTVYQGKGISDGGEIIAVPPAPGKHAGGIFAVGRLAVGGAYAWTVLRSQNAGVAWSLIDSWVPGKNMSAAAKVITSDSHGNIFVAGTHNINAPMSGWWVRRSADGGATWQTILSDYKVTTLPPDEPNGIAADAEGNIYVVGKTHAGGSTAWTVRRWEAASATWDNWPDPLRHPLLGVANISIAGGVTIDVEGNVYVTGSADGHWTVQRLVTAH